MPPNALLHASPPLPDVPSHTRQIETGDLFYPIPHAWWSPSDELFPSAPHSRAAFDALEPFQVFCSWNGMVVMDPAPFLPPHHVRFRRSDPAVGECAASECGLVCADYWKAGFGKIQVVPSVQVSPSPGGLFSPKPPPPFPPSPRSSPFIGSWHTNETSPFRQSI